MTPKLADLIGGDYVLRVIGRHAAECEPAAFAGTLAAALDAAAGLGSPAGGVRKRLVAT